MPEDLPQLMTAREYLNKYEPGVIEIMLDAPATLAREEARAYYMAQRLKQIVRWDDKGLATTDEVWQLIFHTGDVPFRE